MAHTGYLAGSFSLNHKSWISPSKDQFLGEFSPKGDKSLAFSRSIDDYRSKTTMTKIRTEYQRLVDLASTPSGWKEIESEWRTATNVKYVDGKVLSRGESNATVVKGFAIDPVTKRCMTSCATYHSRAYMDMVDWITKNEPEVDVDVVMSRPIKGWIGTILDFEFPCILMGDTRLFSDRALLETLEEAILDQEEGLPLNKLYFENH